MIQRRKIMKREFYSAPEMEVVLFQNADIIRTSDNNYYGDDELEPEE